MDLRLLESMVEGERTMANKKRWTLIDTLIILVVLAAVVVVYLKFGKTTVQTEKKTVEAVMLISEQELEFADALTVGDSITMSLTEKDSGVLKDFRVEPAKTMVYNSIDGTYSTEEIPGKIDVYATIELQCDVSDLAFTVGSTDIKVGTSTPFRGKGYATNGYIIEINE